MERITQKDLEYLVERINNVTDSPKTPYSKNAGDHNCLSGNIGNYHLDYAYGGVKLVQMVNPGGGITEISRDGFGTKRELYKWLRAFLAGHETNKPEKCPESCSYGTSRENCTLGKETTSGCNSPS